MRTRFVQLHWEIVMGQAPLNRDEQIEFMINARERRAAAVDRWSKSDMVQAALREPVHRDAHDSQYSRENVAGRRRA
jgi:hypothetical protein